jgi:predicted Zn-dependent peptidase
LTIQEKTFVWEKDAFQADPHVFVRTLPKGGLLWCDGRHAQDLLRLRVAFVAGSATDPRSERGRARFLAHLLSHRLNLPENPARDLLPPGNARYRVRLSKEWLHIDVMARPADLHAILHHIQQRLLESPLQGISPNLLKQMREELQRSASRLTQAPLQERMDAYLYAGHPRGAYTDGRQRTFVGLSPQALQKGRALLFRSERLRILLVGRLDCKSALQETERLFSALDGSAPTFWLQKDAPNNLETSRRGRLLLAQDALFPYLLPPLTRKDALPLAMTTAIAHEELKRAIQSRFGRSLTLHREDRIFSSAGYLYWHLPQPLAHRGELQTLLRQAIGRLLMSPYNPPELQQIINSYRQEIGLNWADQMASSRGAMALLWSQMRLPDTNPHPYDWRRLLSSLQRQDARVFARRYLNQPATLLREQQPFSLQGIVFFVGSLLVLWFLLDMMIRRSRRHED